MPTHPDYRIEGRYFDAYSPDTSNSRTIAATIRKLVADGECERLVITLAGSDLSSSELHALLTEKRIPGLLEALIIGRDEIVTPWHHEGV